jgi:hypothetical protein
VPVTGRLNISIFQLEKVVECREGSASAGRRAILGRRERGGKAAGSSLALSEIDAPFRLEYAPGS